MQYGGRSHAFCRANVRVTSPKDNSKTGAVREIQTVTRLDLSFCAAEEGHILFPSTTDDSSQPLVDFFLFLIYSPKLIHLRSWTAQVNLRKRDKEAPKVVSLKQSQFRCCEACLHQLLCKKEGLLD